VYTDGACFDNGKENARCGSGIWIDNDDHRNEALRVPGENQSNQIGEIAAIIKAAGAAYLFQPLTIITDSKYVIDGLTEHLNTWEDQGWIGIKNAPHFRKAAYLLRRRTATTHFQWVKGHTGTQGNEESDRLAKAGAEKPTPDPLDLSIPQEFDTQGAKLSTLTQSTAYKGIIQSKDSPDRLSTVRNLQMMRNALAQYTNTLETNETLWNNTRRKEIRTKIKQFLYKAMHGTQKIGPFWRNVNNLEDRQNCGTCGESETMSHILVNCRATPTRLIWGLAKHYWPRAQYKWPEINLGIILGCGSLTAQPIAAQQRNQTQPPKTSRIQGTSRLLRILISESAHLIWVLRCERTIQERHHEENEIKARWHRAINTRLTNDKITATRVKREKGFTNLIVNTWEQVLNKSGDLPNDWLHMREVLVGMR
jgi:ribonuclease HI